MKENIGVLFGIDSSKHQFLANGKELIDWHSSMRAATLSDFGIKEGTVIIIATRTHGGAKWILNEARQIRENPPLTGDYA